MGIGNFAKGAQKAVSRKNMLMNGAVMGGCFGVSKANDVIKTNPYMNQEQKEKTMANKAAKGAAAGVATGVVAGHYLRPMVKGMTGIIKKSEMEVPNDNEKSELPEAEEEVRESPNNEEKEKMRNSINENREHYKNLIEKMSNYQEDINCKKCGYQGEPMEDGRCPKCGVLNGSLPRDGEDCGRVEDDFMLKRLKLEETYHAIQKAKEDMYNQSIYS